MEPNNVAIRFSFTTVLTMLLKSDESIIKLKFSIVHPQIFTNIERNFFSCMCYFKTLSCVSVNQEKIC